ncbi:hypothetical protein Clacol_002266 [Clathrus columnatus]|uniref:Uncharacterized protein n=1 Tax=Clathrus columnatus TaxID=1419009 RepID=A0AAV5A480_9AGAM|nr:hypothetical protein Clacol_002266 [Clathrus columnatus]
MRLSTLYFSSLYSSSQDSQRLERRKGGGGHGDGGEGGGHGSSSGHSSDGDVGSSSSTGGSSSGGSSPEDSSSGSSSSHSSSSTHPLGPRVPIISSGRTANVQSYSNGVAITSPIPAGQLFAGRIAGGGTRADIYGTSRYGSGYPGITSAGVIGRGFPFGFWPVTFGVAVTTGIISADLHDKEYGNPNNSSRPGGPLFEAPFQPMNGSETYRVLSDNTTVQSLIASIAVNCSLKMTTITAIPFNDSAQAINQPKPEQVIQYYRASSIALTLDGYNNTAVYSSNNNTPDTPLLSNLNTTFLNCINQTIGAGAPLFDGAHFIDI